VQMQGTLFDENAQVLEASEPQADETPGFERVSSILNQLFADWDTQRSCRARLETGITGAYDQDLSMALDDCLADEESVADEITATLFMAEAHHE
jgi:hypothetical protein